MLKGNLKNMCLGIEYLLGDFFDYKEKIGCYRESKNMPNDPPIDPINPANVMTSMICLVFNVVLTIKTPEAGRCRSYTGDSSKSGR